MFQTTNQFINVPYLAVPYWSQKLNSRRLQEHVVQQMTQVSPAEGFIPGDSAQRVDLRACHEKKWFTASNMYGFIMMYHQKLWIYMDLSRLMILKKKHDLSINN